MPRKQTGPKPGEWKYRVGDLTAFERPDRKNAIYTRFWNGTKFDSKRWLCDPIRGDAGQVVPEKEIAAQQLTVNRQSEMLAGVVAEDRAGGPLTLARGFRKLLDRKQGKFPTDTGHRREVVRASRLILDVIGGDRRMDEIRHRDYRTVWRHIAHANKKDPKKLGLRTAEIYCGVLQNAARWLQREGLLEPGDAVPAPGWKAAMRVEWEQITGKPVSEPEKPRYTEAESAKLWTALPNADPRVGLAMELGAELRLGQVSRVRRSDVLPSTLHRLGRLRVAGRGKKRGETIVLTMRQRHTLTAAIGWGFLADAENAYRAGEIEDFYLIAAGRVHGAKDYRGRKVLRVKATTASRPLGRRALAKQWEQLEILAGVPHIDGRLWYGMRRHQADKADALEGVSAKAKNRMGGWTKTSTREGYLEQASQRDAEEAARARKRIRPK